MTARILNSPNNAAATNPALIPTGWPLLPLPDDQGQLHYPSLPQSIRQLIEVILRTRPGEQLMRPGFGGGLENFLQQPNTLVTRRRIQSAIAAALQQWEPRILLHRVAVEEVPEKPTHIRIEIVYQIKRSGLAQQLGLTMELEG
ncbi:MAG: GPW/gp25 family protein [Phormidesmis sp.]